jgi:predicted HTH domain antitoxin
MNRGSIIGFKVEEYRQEEDPSWLALRLAEALHTHGQHLADADALRRSVSNEREKAQNMQLLIAKLKTRASQGNVSFSRMDPLVSYNLETCEAELDQYKLRIKEFQEEVNKHLVDANACQVEAKHLQRKIRELTSR